MKWFYLAIFINNAKNTHKNRTEKEETRKKVLKKYRKKINFMRATCALIAKERTKEN